MILDGMDLHNIAQTLERVEETGERTWALLRVPNAVRRQMNPKALEWGAYQTPGVELRFVELDGDEVQLRLFVPPDTNVDVVPVTLYRGSFQSGWRWTRIANLHKGLNVLSVPKCTRVDALRERAQALGAGFSPDVTRVKLQGNLVRYAGVSGGQIRPPHPNEVPGRRAVFYGSSITHGAAAAPDCGFVEICAQETGYDVRNLGFAGACYIENALTDYICSMEEPDFCVAELGTNCFDKISREDFIQRVDTLVERYTAAYPGCPLVLIDILLLGPRRGDCEQVVASIVKKRQNGHVLHVRGDWLIGDSSALSEDGTHPSSRGHRQIAQRLLRVLTGNGVLQTGAAAE